ncbi:hypothetical protein GCM10025771_33910 [Niveibacterium umoris]|uniref:Flp pilus assembly protein TadD n=1 Tax=Niveibacterium umoris TaxID=1193620 RepID=A0A840BKK6_9RHOO|nr:tetratricopeptide repeat protein [Niveibacterium umoris]MBB4011416.1 Flp pilus assembly protein TadD [Niveibacterium umoris]
MNNETSHRFTTGAVEIAENHLASAISLAREGQFEAAVSAFRKALSFVPDRSDAWQGLGYCYRKLSRFAQANEAYGEAQRLDPTRGAVWVNAPVAAIPLH